MDVLLLAVTAGSLLVAFIMSGAAWRLSRLERARSTARVAALAAAAGDSEAPQPVAMSEPQERRVFRSAAAPVERRADTAVERDAIAINETRAASPWAPAKVSAFRVESIERSDREPEWPAEQPFDLPLERRDQSSERGHSQQERRASRSAGPSISSTAFLSSAVAPARNGGPQRGLAIAACVLFVAIVTGGYLTIFGDAAGAAAVDRPASTAPLELVSLRHERHGSSLAITGLVRNPAAGAVVDQLAAVVFLFDQQGNFVTSARADADFKKLSPSDESPFTVTLGAPTSVARYRVSFRNEAGVVPHIDRRGQGPIAKELP